MQSIISEFVSEYPQVVSSSMLLDDIKKGLFTISKKNKFDGDFSTIGKLKELMKNTNYEIKESKLDGRKSYKFVEIVNSNISDDDIDIVDDDISMVSKNLSINLDLNNESDIDEVYASFSLSIIKSDNWEKDFRGRYPGEYNKYITQWLIKNSRFAMILKNGKVETKLNTVSKSDLFKKFYVGRATVLREYLKGFFYDFDFEYFTEIFGKVIGVITPNHPSWEEEYQKQHEIDEKKEEIDRKNREAEQRFRMELLKKKEEDRLERERIEHEKKLEMERIENEKYERDKPRLLNMLHSLKKYAFDSDIPYDDINEITPNNLYPYLTYFEKLYNLHIYEIKTLDRVIEMDEEELDKYELENIVNFVKRKYKKHGINFKPNDYYSVTDPDVKEFLKNTIIIDKLMRAIKEYIGGEDIIKNYEKYLKYDVRNYYEELSSYDDFSNLKFLVTKVIDLYNLLLTQEPDDMELLSVKNYSMGKLRRRDMHEYLDVWAHANEYNNSGTRKDIYSIENDTCTVNYDRKMHVTEIGKWLESYVIEAHRINGIAKDLEKMLIHCYGQNYQCFIERYVEICRNENIEKVQRVLLMQNKNRCTEIQKLRKEKKRIEEENEFARSHDGWWYEFPTEDGSIARVMHFDEDERVMYYYPDENNQTVKSKAYKISDLRDEKKWKRPQLIKAPDNSLEMQVGKTITNVSNVIEFLKLKGLTGQQVFKALSSGGVPTAEEEEEMDDEEKEQLKQQLEEMEEDMRRREEEYRKEQERKEQERLEREQKMNALRMRLEKSKNKNAELREKVDNLEAQNIQ